MYRRQEGPVVPNLRFRMWVPRVSSSFFPPLCSFSSYTKWEGEPSLQAAQGSWPSPRRLGGTAEPSERLWKLFGLAKKLKAMSCGSRLTGRNYRFK